MRNCYTRLQQGVNYNSNFYTIIIILVQGTSKSFKFIKSQKYFVQISTYNFFQLFPSITLQLHNTLYITAISMYIFTFIRGRKIFPHIIFQPVLTPKLPTLRFNYSIFSNSQIFPFKEKFCNFHHENMITLPKNYINNCLYRYIILSDNCP